MPAWLRLIPAPQPISTNPRQLIDNPERYLVDVDAFAAQIGQVATHPI